MSNHMELALSKSPDDNINFVDAIREIKVTVVEIPEQEFPSQMLRNVMVTFFF